MKKLLLVILVFIGLVGASNDALARYGRHRGHYGHGHYDGYQATECDSCHGKGCGRCEEECGPPPCCEREQTITVREAPRKRCGWVCPTDTYEVEIPAAEDSHRHAAKASHRNRNAGGKRY